jgi:hypothetical protein
LEAIVILTDADKAQAKELGLTHEEMRIAKATRIPPERYAFHKRELQAGRDADQAKMEEFAAAVTDQLQYAVRRPDLEEPAPLIEE